MAISGKAKLAGVIGWPVGHSLSPRLHGYWLERYGIDGAYVPLAVKPGEVESALRALPRLGFNGVNVTLPHKEAAAKAVDRMDQVAKRIGAVNTIVVDASGRLSGSNTDGFGFLENLKSAAPNWKPGRAPTVLLGAGGAARAIAAALLDAGVKELRLIGRTRARAEALIRDIDGAISMVPWKDRARALDGGGLLVNATALGMQGNAPLDIDLDALPKSAVV
ncbi:MAG TPA: shikimate dehydrogenase, partial [Rhodospirillales bacterium]